ncbi:Gfo/Idh/MocA family oxidoreductase [Streptomyces sp. MnatMP-M17]|uniref:Gfo/Idh/MocA family protein n=1 Tax=unclassified Streptomyces TaxID=2593676 RepID=UPI00081D7852|nr:Gfo/Idh/MocA family oxidoreductase [Streptomyces sp. MnatMP-M17]MYZ34335.1 Gfo/Idh/MocA family oxidoreductase [Streptomyces sp. SID4917]SCF66487.1 Predicted dehydrogenase [Streptomyces sp. MnatMP-M17]
MSAAPVRFGLVGTGWRSEFFVRLAQKLPDRLTVTGVVSRSPERAAEVEAAWGVPACRSVDELLAGPGAPESPGAPKSSGAPEFVIPSVPWSVTPEVTKDLVRREVPVLAETPPAADLEGLRDLWRETGGSGLVQVAEQYPLMPGHAARLALLREGVIGEVTSVQMSSTHLYHAVSLIRHTLGVGFEPATVTARSFTAPLADPLSREGWADDLTPKDAATTIALLDFGGRMGLYDFTDNQWWNPLRGRRMVVRGSLGEIVDDQVVRMADPRTPVESPLVRRRTGTDLNLEGSELHHITFDGRVVYRNEFVGANLSEDDLAVVDLLCRTGAWVRGEAPEPYPLAEGCQDHQISLAIEESARTGTAVTTTREAWAV